jgi:hypothetical protein
MPAYPRRASSKPMREFLHVPIGTDAEFARFLALRLNGVPDNATWRERQHNRRGLLARLMGRGVERETMKDQG